MIMLNNSYMKKILLSVVILIAFSGLAAAGNNPSFAQKLGQQPASFSNDDNGNSSERNIGAKNILLSLVLPGLGQWVAGEKGRAKVFMVTDLVFLASYFGTREYANVIERDYYTFAAVHAGVETKGKDKQYWIDIGNSQGIYQFNDRQRVGRNLEATYPENDHYFWQWDSEQNRIEYTNLRDKEDNWKQVATFMIGGMVLNRIVSAIDVVRLIRRNKNSSSGEMGYRPDRRYSYLHWSYQNNRLHGEVLQLNFTMKF